MRDVTALFPIPLEWPRLAMDPDDVDAIVIHHTAIDPRSTEPEVALLFPASEMSEEDELNHIRVIHLYHKSKGWGGFAYHIIAFPSRRSYLVVPLSQWGSHVGGRNDTKYGIVAAGDFSGGVPPPPQQYAVVEGIEVIDARLRRQVYVGPHREFTATSCPGTYWWQWVPQLRTLPKEEDGMDEERVARIESHVKDFGQRMALSNRLHEILSMVQSTSPKRASPNVRRAVDAFLEMLTAYEAD